MRYRVIAKSLMDRRRLLAMDDDGNYYLVLLNGVKPTQAPIDQREARRLQFDRNWIPAVDHAPRTMRDLSDAATYQ
ncbi:MAG: hypothetical protein ACTHMR_05435 [Thermomicrobiales bacterium]